MERRRLIGLVALAAIASACGDLYDPVTEPVDGSGSVESSAGASVTPTASEAAPATLTLGGGLADGPGNSVSEAIARVVADPGVNADRAPDLVNGILLRDATGQVWLCEALTDTTPPNCAAPRLLVVNFPSDVADFAPSPRPDNRQEADGVMWYVGQQLTGFVEP
jgi:hypothetical protein